MARARSRVLGSQFWRNFDLLAHDRAQQKSILLVELAKYPPVSKTDMEEYEIWESSGFRLLPEGGGWRNQPAGLMARLQQIKIMLSLTDRYFSIEREEAEQVRIAQKQASAVDKAEQGSFE